MFFTASQGELTLIIDVQSSVVRGSLVHLRRTEIPIIVYTHTVLIPHKPGGGSAYLIKMALQAVEEIARVVRGAVRNELNAPHIPRHVSSIHYVLSSPWVVSQAKTLSLSFKENMPVSSAYISGIIWEERNKMTANATDDIRVIEEKVFDVRLNGYSVASWESKHTRELGISFVVSIAGGRMIDSFIRASEDLVKLKSRVHFHSSLFSQHVGIQKIMPQASSYGLIHVHGELTDVAIIHAHECSFFGSYPLGIKGIIRSVARADHTTEDAAESTLNLITSSDLDSSRARNEVARIEKVRQEWITHFKNLLTAGTPPQVVPPTVIISAHSHEDFFVETFKSAYPQTILEVLSLDAIVPHVSYDPTIERLRLTGLYVLAIDHLSK